MWEKKAHSTKNIIGNIKGGVIMRCQMKKTFNYICFTSTILPKNVKEALQVHVDLQTNMLLIHKALQK